MWIDGVNVLPMHRAPNKYPGMRNYLSVGLYRNGHIGDPNLLWPGTNNHVYGTDGTPGVAYIDGFIAGLTREAVEPPGSASSPFSVSCAAARSSRRAMPTASWC